MSNFSSCVGAIETSPDSLSRCKTTSIGEKMKFGIFYEHQLPKGTKAYNKTKPININEFDTLKSWWGNEDDGFISRVENEHAWKLSIDEIKDLNFNLDVKNPNTLNIKSDQDPKILLEKFKSLESETNNIREQIHKILLDCFN